ncbi:MAG TPA: hypothetical protein VIA18_03595, partial [Polyangia bacterium]|nr:hypothetical protein [Polyangia bacterium]
MKAPPRSQRVDWAVVALLTLALGLRLVYVLKVAPGAVHSDQEDYLEAARRLLDGRAMAFRNYHLFVRPPGFSLFIALVWKLTAGRSIMAVKLAQAVVGTATCWYVGQLTTRLTPQRWARLIALAGAAVYPY